MLLKNSAWPMPPIAVQNPDSGRIEAWFDESFDEVQTMLAILLEKAGLPEGDLSNEAEAVRILKVQAEVSRLRHVSCSQNVATLGHDARHSKAVRGRNQGRSRYWCNAS